MEIGRRLKQDQINVNFYTEMDGIKIGVSIKNKSVCEYLYINDKRLPELNREA